MNAVIALDDQERVGDALTNSLDNDDPHNNKPHNISRQKQLLSCE